MSEAILLNVAGIKCDAPGCDYSLDEEIADYGVWLNVPCPKCGHSLLTPEDYALVKLIRASVDYANEMFGEVAEDSDAKRVKIELGMNGTGSLEATFEAAE